MADDTSREPLDSNTNDLPDPPIKIIPVVETETITPIQQTENMEVHKHPHHVTHKKKWPEYLLEFLMIFLAVTLGFFAESLREHFVNKEREKQYIHSFYKDLQTDQEQLPLLIKAIERQQVEAGSYLPVLFSKATTTTYADSIYYFLRKFIRQQGIKAFVTDNTIEQIKNAGEMRLITNKQIADSLTNYYKEVIMTDYLQQSLLAMKSKLWDNLPLILKSAEYTAAINSNDEVIMPAHHVYLLSNDPLVLNRILIEVEDIRALSNTIKSEIELLLRENSEIEKLIHAEYKIEN